MIHASAIVDASARIDPTAEIGPYCVIEGDVTIGPRTRLVAHVYVGARTAIGEDNTFYPYATVGVASQDKKYAGEQAETRMGDRNTVREFVSIHRGTAGGGGLTTIGNDNWIMAYAHIAHDNRIGNGTILGHGVTFAGHVTVDDYANVGAHSGVHQFCRIGRYAMVAGYSVILKNVLPFSMTVAERKVKTFAENKVGLERNGFDGERIAALHKAFRILSRAGLNTTQAIERIREEIGAQTDVAELIEFIGASSERGFIK